MLFTPKADIDKSSIVVTEILTHAGKINEDMQYLPILVDFKNENLMVAVDSKNIYGVNPQTQELTIWENTEDLVLNLRNYRPSVINVGDSTVTVEGLIEVDYDVATKLIYVKSNTLGMKQQSLKVVLCNFIAYMLLYRNLKMSGKQLGEPYEVGKGGKPKNFYKSEFELFQAGYMPLALVSPFEYPELKAKIIECIENTPLTEGMRIEKAYDVKGRALREMEMIWITKRSLYCFLESIHPGTYAKYGYEILNLKTALVNLFEYNNLFDKDFYISEYSGTIPEYPDTKAVNFHITVDDLGINRMIPYFV